MSAPCKPSARNPSTQPDSGTAAGPFQQLRRTLRASGPQGLSAEQLLTVLLGPGGHPEKLASALLDHIGGLKKLPTADVAVLRKLPGIGPSRAARLMCAAELAQRVAAPHRPVNPVTSPADSRRFFAARLGGLRRESFACLYLDTRHRPIDFQVLFQGTVDSAAVYPREVVRHCLERDASAVIVAHNHPSGDPTPSHADLAITDRLKTALALLDIRLLDHLIIADLASYSFAEQGRL